MDSKELNEIKDDKLNWRDSINGLINMCKDRDKLLEAYEEAQEKIKKLKEIIVCTPECMNWRGHECNCGLAKLLGEE